MLVIELEALGIIFREVPTPYIFEGHCQKLTVSRSTFVSSNKKNDIMEYWEFYKGYDEEDEEEDTDQSC